MSAQVWMSTTECELKGSKPLTTLLSAFSLPISILNKSENMDPGEESSPYLYDSQTKGGIEDCNTGRIEG